MQNVVSPPRTRLHRGGGGRLPWSRFICAVPALAFVGLTGHSALAGTSAETLSGVPVLPVPLFDETGLPAFTMPAGATVLSTDMPAGGDGSVALGGGGSGAAPGSGNGDTVGSAAASWTQYAGQSVGSGQCVALVQAADAGAGLTASWSEGAQGMQAMDQWSDHAASYRTIPWDNPGATAANSGSQLRVVSHAP